MMRNDFVSYNGLYYRLHPAYLNWSLHKSLRKLNLETIDAAILANPFEVCLNHYGSKDQFYNKLALAFEFYERAV